MPYVTSIERLAREEGKSEGKIEGTIEGKIKGKIQLLQDLLGLPVSSDKELEGMSADQLEAHYSVLRARVKT